MEECLEGNVLRGGEGREEGSMLEVGLQLVSVVSSYRQGNLLCEIIFLVGKN